DRHLYYRRRRAGALFLQRLAPRSRPCALVGVGGSRVRRPLRVRLRRHRLARHARTFGAGGASDREGEPRSGEGARGGRRDRAAALHDVSRARADGGDWRGAEGRAPRYARTYRPLRARHSPAGGSDPCDAAEQFHRHDGRRARRAGAVAQAGDGSKLMGAEHFDADLVAGRRLMGRLDAFAAFTEEPGRLTRVFLSDAHRRAAHAFIGWCGEAGLGASIDAAGNVVARYEGRRAGAPALMLGSHIDTVRDAGRYDGNYGALAALAVVETLSARGERLDHAIEIVAFGDE